MPRRLIGVALLGLMLPAASAAPALAAEGRVEASAPRTADGHTTVRVRWRGSVSRRPGTQRGIVVLNERRSRTGPVLRRHIIFERRRAHLDGVRRYTFRFPKRRAHSAAGPNVALDASATQQSDADGDGTYEDTRVSAPGKNCETLAPNVDISNCDLNSLFAPNVDLTNATAIKTLFDGAVMTNGTLEIMIAPTATFRGAHLKGARFAGSVLVGVDATAADFTGGSLQSTQLQQAVLLNATITGTSFRGAMCGDTTWIDGSTVSVCPGA
jgi:Pentapeptide repeats (8 copies)